MARIEAVALGYTKRMTRWAPNSNLRRRSSVLP